MIEVAIRQQRARDWRVAQRARVKPSEPFDLRSNFRRDVQQKPGHAIGTQRDALLSSRPCTQGPAANAATIRAAAVPLWKTTASGGPQHSDQQACRSFASASVATRSNPVEVFLIRADLSVHFDFDE
jgi:hypothetical protein